MVAEQSSRILLVEDEKNLGSTLTELLTDKGYSVELCPSAESARTALSGARFDLALLDIGLPDGNGFQIAELMRKSHRTTAIVFLTAFGSPEDRIKGLELGAEDYIVKPFHLKELLLRVQNALKRARYLESSSEHDGIKLGEATLYFSSFEIEIAGQRQPLTHKECAVLQLLYMRRGKVVSRDEILNEAWPAQEYPSPRTVDNFILRLRKFIEKDPENPTLIRSIRGVGYQLL